MSEKPDFYSLKEEFNAHPSVPMFASAAIISCGLCNTVIAGMGGPGNGCVCARCGDELRKGRLRGAVVWTP